MKSDGFKKLEGYHKHSESEMVSRSKQFYESIKIRRTVRTFSDKTFPIEVLINCIKAAGTAPNGANLQPWHFVLVKDHEIKKRIRTEAEKEEYEFYHGKAPQEWLDVLAPLGVDEHKPFLETAPYLIVIFEKKFNEAENGKKSKNYYTKESVGIATGLLINAIHECGLASLTHTPSPMNFLNEILRRPSNEKPFLILVVGLPEDGTVVPDITRKEIDDILTVL